MKTQKEILAVIAESLSIPPTDLDPQASLRDDMSLNPVEMADLFHSLADQFNFVFTPTELEEVETVSDLMELIEDKQLEG